MPAGFGATINFSAQAEDKVSGPMEKAAVATKGMGGAAKTATTSLSSMGSLSALMPGVMGPAVASMGAMSAALGPIAIAAGIAIAAIGGFNMAVNGATQTLETSIGTFGVFEKKLAEVQTILGVTRGAMEEVTDVALDFGATYGKSAAEELEGFYQTASAGFADAAQAATVMDTANKLAVAGITDMNSSVDLLTTVLNGFGLAAEASGEVSDALFTTVRAGKTTVGELSSAFGTVVPSASAAGAKLDETLSALAALTLAGQSTAEASTALARSFDVLIKQPPIMIKEFKKFGIEAADLNVKERGLLPVIKSISEGFKGNEEALAKAIPQIRAFKAIMPLAGKQMAAFEKTLASMEGKLGATDDAFEIIANTLSFQQDRWRSMMEGIRTRVGQVFAPALRKALDILNDLLGLIEKLPPEMKSTIFAFAGLGLALPTVVGKFTSFVWAAVKVGAALGVVASILPLIAPQLGIAGLAFGPLIGRAIKFATAWRKNLDGMRDRVKKWGENIKLVLKGLGEAILHKGYIRGPIDQELKETGLLPWVSKLYQVFEGLRTFFESFWEGFSAAVLGGAESLGEAFPELQAILDFFKMGEEGAENMGKKLPIETFGAMGKKAGEEIGKIIGWIGDFGDSWEENKSKVEEVTTAIEAVADAIKQITPAVEAMWAVVGPILDSMGAVFGILTGVVKAPTIRGTRTRFVPEEFETVHRAGGVSGFVAEAAEGPRGRPGMGTPPGEGAVGAPGGAAVKEVANIRIELDIDKSKVAEKVIEATREAGEETFKPSAL